MSCQGRAGRHKRVELQEPRDRPAAPLRPACADRSHEDQPCEGRDNTVRFSLFFRSVRLRPAHGWPSLPRSARAGRSGALAHRVVPAARPACGGRHGPDNAFAESGAWVGPGDVVLTILVGRVFCGFVCPFGRFTSRGVAGAPGAPSEGEDRRQRVPARAGRQVLHPGRAARSRSLLNGQHFVGRLHIGLLDPIALLSRASTWPSFRPWTSPLSGCSRPAGSRPGPP